MSFKETLNEWGAKKTPFVFLLDFEKKNSKAWRLEDCPSEFKFNFQGITNQENDLSSSKNLKFKITPPNQIDYINKYHKVINAIQMGETYLINLTTKGQIETNLSLEDLFNSAKSKYKILLKDHFVSFSPETFIQIKDGIIKTFPMKGTIDATIKNAQQLLEDNEKEKAEHATIVDLLRNDLSTFAKKVRVEKYRYYEVIKANNKQVGQMSSEISGELPMDYRSRIGDIIYHLTPAGSISGAPKPKTLELIKEIEQECRGFYTGIAGYFDGNNLDSCVLIRYLEKDGTYRCGGGVTSKSKLKEEYEELIQKMYVPIY
ncbi:MAG: aminodeoxychorismate synthase component I [Flavobacteriaceae bacterium]